MSMLGLRCNGHVIMNCLQLYREANIHDLLKQPEAFKAFVHAHCLFGSKETMLKRVLDKLELPSESTERSILDEFLDEELKEKPYAQKVADEIRDYREQVSRLPKVRRQEKVLIDRIAVMGLLSRIPMQRLEIQLQEEHAVQSLHSREKAPSPSQILPIPSHYVSEESDVVLFGNDHTIHLTESAYQFRFNDRLELKDGQKIQSYCLMGARAAGTKIVFIDPEQRIINTEIIKQGEFMFVNVVEQVIVRVLPRQIRRGDSSVSRNAARELVINGHNICGTESVTSFAMDVNQGHEQVIWVQNGYLKGNIADMRISAIGDVVEVVILGEKYYVLNSTGTVISNDFCVDGKNCVVSLKRYMEEFDCGNRT